MKRTVKSLAAVVVYMLLLCLLLKTNAILLFSPRHIGMFLLGCGILCLPYAEKKMNWKEGRDIFKKNAILAGYLETFMLMFVSMNQNRFEESGVWSEFALNLRPLFYGFVCHMVIGNEPAEKIPEEEPLAGGLPKKEPGESKAPVKAKEPSEEMGGEKTLDLSRLTRQERQVAELIKRGMTNREIGEELCISEATVKKHVSNIFEKLGIGSRRELR